MKPSTKAAIYSAFIFPGAGLWSLGQRARAAIFGIPALIAFAYMLVGSWQIANRITVETFTEKAARDLADKIQDGFPNFLSAFFELIKEILIKVRFAIGETPSLEHAQWIFIVAWLLSIASSYAVGKLQDQKISTTTDTTSPKE